MREKLCSLLRVPQLAVPRLRSPRFRRSFAVYSEALERLYRAIRSVSGCRVIVDSSKYPPEAFLLRDTDGIRLHVVHLVRDANAVVHAWQKEKRRPEIHWKEAYFPRYSPVTTSVAWSVFSGLFELIGSGDTPYRLVRYEDLVREPRRQVDRVLELVGMAGEVPAEIRPAEVVLGDNHTVSGNPVRFERGSVALRVDTDWQDAMGRGQRALVNLLTYPGQRRYGYL